jgi:hypothetical protein
VDKKSISVTLWIVAFVLTVILAVFQRMTGPSYPKRGEAPGPGDEEIRFRLPRTHGGAGGLEVAIDSVAGVEAGFLEWRRYPVNEPWRSMAMTRGGDGRFTASIPHQPPAGKVEYRLVLETVDGMTTIPADEPVVARFRAAVPAWVLIPHILAMFGTMLVATRSLLEVVRPAAPAPRRLVLVAMGLLIVGGLFLGPVVQKFAFDAYWTGWPFGHDLTDNKTLIAFIAWLPATILAVQHRRIRAAVIIGWMVMMAAFLIPHSLRGSEMDWSEGEIKTGCARVAAGPIAPV